MLYCKRQPAKSVRYLGYKCRHIKLTSASAVLLGTANWQASESVYLLAQSRLLAVGLLADQLRLLVTNLRLQSLETQVKRVLSTATLTM